ncbi:MAG: ferritin-like domain-containing protein [Candidatus Bathyarchaeota archaeon]|nr:MAG: ferritin-like domain-containing protein [Candidatus Bathyarchaeota archaeon]
MSKLIQLLEEQRDLELAQVERIQPTIHAVSHRLVSALLETIAHDSRKHAALCQALVDVKAGTVPTTLDTDMATAVGLHQSIKQHVRVEEEMIRRLEAILEKVEDDRVRAILGFILRDERRHHATLQRLSNLIDRDTAAFDEYLTLFQKYMVSPP